MAMIDNRIYVAGRPTAAPANLDETYELLRERDGMAWIGLYRPGEAEIHSVAAEFSLHPLAVEDALKGHQRAKLERYGDTLFVVLRPAWYLDAEGRNTTIWPDFTFRFWKQTREFDAPAYELTPARTAPAAASCVTRWC